MPNCALRSPFHWCSSDWSSSAHVKSEESVVSHRTGLTTLFFFLHFREGLNASKPQHAYTVECTPTSEVNHALRVYVAGSGNNKCGSYQLARSKTPRASVSTQTKPVNKMFELCKPSGRWRITTSRWRAAIFRRPSHAFFIYVFVTFQKRTSNPCRWRPRPLLPSPPALTSQGLVTGVCSSNYSPQRRRFEPINEFFLNRKSILRNTVLFILSS